jgi:hypothetical protein
MGGTREGRPSFAPALPLSWRRRPRSGGTAMTRVAALAVVVLAVAGLGGEAAADGLWPWWPWPAEASWRTTHNAIYELENRIALLEADPYIDDGHKAPIIARTRAEVARLRRTLRPTQWRWAVPCCYSRPPIHFRFAGAKSKAK